MEITALRQLLKKAYKFLPLKRQAFEIVRRATPLPPSITQHLHFEGPFTVRIDKEHSFRLHHWGFSVENDLFWHGWAKNWEATSLALWSLLAPAARTILDVGANTGVYALAARALNPTAKIFAFEPVLRVYTRLRQNIALNNFDVSAHQIAVSDFQGSARMYETASDHLYSASLDKLMLANEEGVTSHEISTTRLDTFLATHDALDVDLIKIDVEKYEPQVLTGLGRVLERNKPTLLVEVLDNEVAESLHNIVDGLGYEIYSINESAGISALPRVSSHKSSDRNVLLIQSKVRQATAIGHLYMK